MLSIALVWRHVEARDQAGFFQAVRSVLARSEPGDRRTDKELDRAIRQIISKAVVSGTSLAGKRWRCDSMIRLIHSGL